MEFLLAVVLFLGEEKAIAKDKNKLLFTPFWREKSPQKKDVSLPIPLDYMRVIYHMVN